MVRASRLLCLGGVRPDSVAAKLAISIARKAGVTIFVVPEDIVVRRSFRLPRR